MSNKSVDVQFEYRFWPVGQGLFSTGKITVYPDSIPYNNLRESDALTVRWVYDCGSTRLGEAKLSDGSKGKKANLSYVKGCVHAYRQQENLATGAKSARSDPEIEALFISHFDMDHISGIHYLLSNVSVGKIYLPYLTPAARLAVALGTLVRAPKYYWQFLRDPVQALREWARDPKPEVVSIIPSSPDATTPEPEGPRPLIDPTPESKKLTRQERSRSSATKILAEIEQAGGGALGSETDDTARATWMDSGQAIHALGVWEFIPWCIDIYKKTFDPDFQKTAFQLLDKIYSASDSVTIRKYILDIKKIYEKQLANAKFSSNEHKNRISLFLYSAPLKCEKICACEGSFNQYEPSRPPHLCFRFRENIGWMATGDGFLTNIEWDAFNRAFSQHSRLEHSGVFQIPHHGSRKNWHPGLASKVQPVCSIVNYGGGNTHRHPSPEVVDDFTHFNLHHVTDTIGWQVRGWCRFNI